MSNFLVVLSCFSDGLCLNPILSPLTNAGLSFPIHLVPIGLGKEQSPSLGQDHVAKPDCPGCLLPVMKLWIRINETQHCFISHTFVSLSVDGEMQVWPQQQHLGLLTLWPSPCFRAQETRTNLQRANSELQMVLQMIWLRAWSVGSQGWIFQRMLRGMKTSCLLFSLL